MNIKIQDTLERIDTIGEALYSLSHLIAIVDNTPDQISYLQLSNLLSLMADGVNYRRQIVCIELKN
ncbi:hypothetical protein [Haemophilus parahaemolyticus]